MNEQQRLLVAIALSIMIISGWQMIMPKPEIPIEIADAPITATPPKAPALEKSASAETESGAQAALEAQAIAAGKAIPSPGPKKIEVPEVRYEFSNEVLNAEITNKNGVHFSGLKLKKYKERLEEEESETGNPIIPGLVSLLTGKENENVCVKKF